MVWVCKVVPVSVVSIFSVDVTTFVVVSKISVDCVAVVSSVVDEAASDVNSSVVVSSCAGVVEDASDPDDVVPVAEPKVHPPSAINTHVYKKKHFFKF